MTEQSNSLIALNEDLLRAHATGDAAEMIDLYARAGTLAFEAGDIDAGCFYTTHAYVHALEEGDALSEAFRAVLQRHGREA